MNDVLYTGRTTRAALNGLFDFGRPHCVELAVLIDRGERQLPIAATYCAQVLDQQLPPNSNLELSRDAEGHFDLKLSLHN